MPLCVLPVPISVNINMQLGGHIQQRAFSVHCSPMYALMTLLLMLVILFVAYGDQISVVALPLTTRTSSSAARLVLIPSRNEKLIFFLLFDLPCHSIYTGYASVLAFSTSIANTSQSVLVSKAARPFMVCLLEIDYVLRLY